MKTLSDTLDTLKTKNAEVQQVVERLRFSRLRLYCVNDDSLHFLVDDRGHNSDLLEREQSIQLLLEDVLGCAVLIHTVTAMEDLYASSYEAQAIPLDAEKECIEQRYKTCFGQAPVVFYTDDEQEAHLNYGVFFDQAVVDDQEENCSAKSSGKGASASVPFADFLGNVKRKLGLSEQPQTGETTLSTTSIKKALHIHINNTNNPESHLSFSMPFPALTRPQKKVVSEVPGKPSVTVDNTPLNQSYAS